MRKIFVAGTDTEIGKTTISVGLLQGWRQHGYQTLAFKPIASGCDEKDGKLYNDDALQLSEAATIKLPYESINPFAYRPPISPNIAMANIGEEVLAQQVVQQLSLSFNHAADYCLVEGTGGWYSPLNSDQTMADIAKILNFDVLLVVGIKLGCLNHALLTVEAIKQCGLPLIGWVANCLYPDTREIDANILTLERYIDAPCLAIVPHQGVVADHMAAMPAGRQLLQQQVDQVSS